MPNRASVLRTWSVDDGRWYVDQSREAEVQRFTTESVDTTVEQFHAALRTLTDDDVQFGRAIVDSDSGELAGNLAASREADVALVSYWVAEKYRGRGLAHQAVEECCQCIEVHWPDVVYAQLSIHTDNGASIRVSAAAGFVRDPARDKVISVRGSNGRCTLTFVVYVSRRVETEGRHDLLSQIAARAIDGIRHPANWQAWFPSESE